MKMKGRTQVQNTNTRKPQNRQFVKNRGGGGANIPSPSPELMAFNKFLEGLPPVLSQWGFEQVFAGMKKNEKETMDIVDRLLRCLQSQKASTQRVRDSFVLLVILITTNTHVKPEKVLELINQIFVTDGDNTRGERRAVYAGKIMGFGAIIRSHRLDSLRINAVNDMIAQLVSLAEKRTSLLTIATPFLCSILSETFKEKQRQQLDFSPLQSLLQLSSKQQLAAIFRVSLAVADKELGLETPLLASVESIVDTVVGVVRHDDKPSFRLLFRYLNAQKLTKQFWKSFSSQLGAYHFELLQTSILVALETGCPLKHILRKSVIKPLVALFRSGDNEMIKKVVAIFRRLLDWEKEDILAPKGRLAAIKLLFGDLELSSEYRFLFAIFRRFLTFLNGEEIEALVTLCQGQSEVNARGGNSTISFLAIIAPCRKTPLETKLGIAKELFENGFCTVEKEKNGAAESVASEILVMRQRLSGTAFVSILRHTYEADFIHKMFSYVRKIATGKKEGVTLVKAASEEDLANFKIIHKLLKKLEDPDLGNCVQIYGIYSVVDSPFAIAGLDTLIPLCEKSLTLDRPGRALEIITFILGAIESEHVIFDHEAIFQKLLIEKNVHADSVQLLVKIIDVDMADALDDDDESSDDDADDTNIDLMNVSEFPLESKVNGTDLPSFAAGDDSGPDSDEESLDMDAVGESELSKMDAALANVFSTKKRVKAERRMEETLTLRVLNLLRILLRRYPSPDDGAIPLLILIPALTLLRKTGKIKKAEIHARGADVVKRLNAIRHIGNAMTFEPPLIQNAKKDIEGMLEKKLPKNVRQLLIGSLEMLRRCFHIQLEAKEVKKRKKMPIEGGVAKRKRTLSN